MIRTPEASCTHNIEVACESLFRHSPLAQSYLASFSTIPSQAGIPGGRIAGDQAAALGRQRRLEPDRGAAQCGRDPNPASFQSLPIRPFPHTDDLPGAVSEHRSGGCPGWLDQGRGDGPDHDHQPLTVASNSHPVQPETPSSVSLPAPTPSTVNSFGQLSTVDSLSWRTSWFGSEPEVAALID